MVEVRWSDVPVLTLAGELKRLEVVRFEVVEAEG